MPEPRQFLTETKKYEFTNEEANEIAACLGFAHAVLAGGEELRPTAERFAETLGINTDRLVTLGLRVTRIANRDHPDREVRRMTSRL